jgi:hypothetical protein
LWSQAQQVNQSRLVITQRTGNALVKQRTYEVPESLAPAIAVADKYGVLVTSTTGGTHNKGSKHYQKQAFDVDNRKLDANPKLKQAFFSELSGLGYSYFDEVKRPKGQAVWGGPHYHIQKGLGQPAKQSTMAPIIGKSASVSLPKYPEPAPYVDTIGSWEELQQRLNQGGGLYRQGAQQKEEAGLKKFQQSFNKQAQKTIEVKPLKTKYKQVDNGFDNKAFIQDLIDQSKSQKVQYQPPPRNPIEQFGEGFKAPFMGYSNDVVAQQEGSSIPYNVGNFLGQVGAIGIPTVIGGLAGGPIGGLAGSGLAQGVIGERSEAQRERLAGEPDNIGKRLGAGALNLGLGVTPGIGAGMKLLPRLGLNIGAQTALSVGGDAGLQAIEQGTVTPQLDTNRLKMAAGLGAAGGVAGGLLTRGAPKPVTVKAPRVTLPQQGPMKAPRVVLGGIEVGAPVVEAPRSTLDPTNPASYGLPETPKVKAVEYAAPAAVEGEQLKLFGPKGVDAALYDAANSTPETNPAAWAAAREGLQEYGDLNIQDVGKKVGEVVDALPPGEVVPENITQRLVAPKSKDPIANASPRPQTPAEIVATSRKLAGTVDEMIAQGTEASPIKTREQYNNLTKAYKELYGGITRYNKDVKNGLIDLSDLTPEVMAQRGGMLNDMINTGAIIPQARIVSPKVLQDFRLKYEKMTAGLMNAGELAQMQATIADMEYRAQLQSLSDQMETIHPEVRKAWEFDYDPQTKLAMQKEGADIETSGGKKLRRFEDIMDGLPETLYNRTMMIKDATERGASLRIDADTEITGATSRVSQREVTPIGGFRTKDGHIGFVAYNDDGHLASYYITPKANPKTGMISQVKSVEILGSEKFRGEYANVYLGPREFRIDDILKRPPRSEGLTSSEARKILKQAAGVLNDPELQALNPKIKELAYKINNNPDTAQIKEVESIREILKMDKKVLKAACELLGRM